jgi:hypothetical protein
MQDLTFLARRFLEMTKDGLERSLPWADRELLDIRLQEGIAENIATMEEMMTAIKAHASKLGIGQI